MNVTTHINQLDLSKQYTYADYLNWKFEEPVELIKGWIHKMSPAPNLRHQKISGNIFAKMHTFFEDSQCETFSAPFDVRLFKHDNANNKVTTVIQPDICVVCDKAKLDSRGCIGAPDLIIEITSPGNSKRELKLKFDLYQENGVQEYWVVIPDENSLQQYFLVNNKYTLINTFFEDEIIECKIFSSLKIDLQKVF